MKSLINNKSLAQIALLTIGVISCGAHAAEPIQPEKWRLKTSLALVNTDEPFSIENSSGGEVSAGSNVELGTTVSLEYRWTDLIALEFSAAYAKTPDIKSSGDDDKNEIGEGADFVPLSAGINFNLVRTDSIDIYAGLRVAYVMFGDFDLRIDDEDRSFEVEDDFGWGATIGINYHIGLTPWSLIAEANYLSVDKDISETGTDNQWTTNFDPLSVNLGVSYRF